MHSTELVFFRSVSLCPLAFSVGTLGLTPPGLTPLENRSKAFSTGTQKSCLLVWTSRRTFWKHFNSVRVGFSHGGGQRWTLSTKFFETSGISSANLIWFGDGAFEMHAWTTLRSISQHFIKSRVNLLVPEKNLSLVMVILFWRAKKRAPWFVELFERRGTFIKGRKQREPYSCGLLFNFLKRILNTCVNYKVKKRSPLCQKTRPKKATPFI